MSSPKVSVIVPVYNGAPYVAEAIQSVLDQTLKDFELIIVNDASPDESVRVIKQFNDPRLRYIEHRENRGAGAARNTGIGVSSGDTIAFLDQDDLFHAEKLQTHVAFLEKNPLVGLTYNPRYELLNSHSSKMIRDLWRPPRKVTLADMVLGFPFSPSDMVIRRDWVFRAGGANFCPDSPAGGEIDVEFHLWLEGCEFASVDRALNYRRPHSGKLGNLPRWCKEEIRAQERVFTDPRCPNEVLALRDIAHANIYLTHSAIALAQEETSLGQQFMREAARMDPTIIEGQPCRLVNELLAYGIKNENLDHESTLRSMFAQLPEEFARFANQCDWAVQRGYIWKGARAIIWGRPEDGQKHFNRAKSLGAQVDEPFLQWLTQKLIDYKAEFGVSATETILRDLAPYVEMLGGRSAVRWLKGCYSINQAFESYRAGEYATVPKNVMRAVANEHAYLGNRGVLSILLRSITGTGRPAEP